MDRDGTLIGADLPSPNSSGTRPFTATSRLTRTYVTAGMCKLKLTLKYDDDGGE